MSDAASGSLPLPTRRPPVTSPLTAAEVRRLRALHDKRHREEQGWFGVEGEKVVTELSVEGPPWEELLVTSASALATRAGARVISAADMARISHFPTPSTAFGVLRLRRESLGPQELARGRTLALDGVQDAGNVGTLLRIADWFGLDRVLLGSDCADLFSQKVINASMGSFSRVRVVTAPLAEALATVPAEIPVIGCDLHGEELGRMSPVEHGVMVIGSEGRGLSPPVAARVTRRVTIPRFGRAESLNAAVAAGIVCAHLRR